MCHVGRPGEDHFALRMLQAFLRQLAEGGIVG